MLGCVAQFNTSTTRYSGEYSKWLAFVESECKGAPCLNLPKLEQSFNLKSLLTGNVYSARVPHVGASGTFFYVEVTVQYSKEEASRDAEWCILNSSKGI